jgi:hypothetical protein
LAIEFQNANSVSSAWPSIVSSAVAAGEISARRSGHRGGRPWLALEAHREHLHRSRDILDRLLILILEACTISPATATACESDRKYRWVTSPFFTAPTAACLALWMMESVSGVRVAQTYDAWAGAV